MKTDGNYDLQKAVLVIDQHFLNFMANSSVGSPYTVGAITDNPGSTSDYIFV